jgi:hypothetical protein
VAITDPKQPYADVAICVLLLVVVVVTVMTVVVVVVVTVEEVVSGGGCERLWPVMVVSMTVVSMSVKV